MIEELAVSLMNELIQWPEDNWYKSCIIVTFHYLYYDVKISEKNALICNSFIEKYFWNLPSLVSIFILWSFTYESVSLQIPIHSLFLLNWLSGVYRLVSLLKYKEFLNWWLYFSGTKNRMNIQTIHKIISIQKSIITYLVGHIACITLINFIIQWGF